MLFISSVHPGQGLTQVIEKAETSLGIPSPTELSAQVEEEQKERSKALLYVVSCVTKAQHWISWSNSHESTSLVHRDV